jgi:hypothetical protein
MSMLSIRRKLLEQGTTDARAFKEEIGEEMCN